MLWSANPTFIIIHSRYAAKVMVIVRSTKTSSHIVFASCNYIRPTNPFRAVISRNMKTSSLTHPFSCIVHRSQRVRSLQSVYEIIAHDGILWFDLNSLPYTFPAMGPAKKKNGCIELASPLKKFSCEICMFRWKTICKRITTASAWELSEPP